MQHDSGHLCACHVFAELPRVVEACMWVRMHARAGGRLGEFTARNLANCLWALAKMGHHPGADFLAALSAEVAKKLPGCNAQNLVPRPGSSVQMGKQERVFTCCCHP